MIPFFILGICLLVGFVLLARWFVAAEPRAVLWVLRWVAAFVAIVIGGFLIWGGRQALAAIVFPLLLPLLLRYRALWARLKSAAGPSPGQTSQVETRFLRMTLDHDTGAMSGVVLDGEHRGRSLEEMSLPDLVDLLRQCRAEDPQSVAVLEAYLDRIHGADWRAHSEEGQGGSGARYGGGAAASTGAMTREEALEILGLQPDATPDEIRDAHRRMMQQYHPDRGGSNYLAAKVNQAKDRLLAR